MVMVSLVYLGPYKKCTRRIYLQLLEHRLQLKHGFTSRVFLHCALLKGLHGFKEERAHKVRVIQFFLQNVKKRFLRF